MAEEVDILSLWQKSKAFERPVSVDFDQLEKTKTKTTLHWIKFILRIEFWLNIALFPFVFYDTYFDQENLSFTIFYIFIFLVYFAYYSFLIRQIKVFSYDGDVVKSLKKVYGYLNFYLLHYKVVIWLSMTFGFFYAFVLEWEEKEKSILEIALKDNGVPLLISLIIILAIGSILHSLVHLIYGRKIKRLKGIVKDLEKVD